MATIFPALGPRTSFRGLGIVAGFAGFLGIAAGTAHAQPIPPPKPAPCPATRCRRVPLPPPAAPAPSGSGGPSFWSDPNGFVDHVLTEWLWQFLAHMIHEALTGVLGILARSVLATPQVAVFPVVGQVWTSSQQIVVGVYGIVILCGGIVVMGYQTVQTRTSMKDMLPRLVFGFIAANMSLVCIRTLIDWANALSSAILGDDLGMPEACRILTDTLTGHLSTVNNQFSPFYVLFTALVFVVMLVAVVLTYVVRVMLTVVLACASPLALMCHGMPQTEKVAFWWWKAFTGVLLIQIVQSVTLIATVKLFFLPGGITLF